MTTLTLEAAIRKLTNMAESAKHQLDLWQTKFASDPAHAFAWSDGAFEDAAVYEIADGWAKFLTGEINPDFAGDRVAQAILEIEREHRYKSGRRECSTSQSSNLMEDCRRVARAKVLRVLNGELF
jgi:hypothetical protein